MEILKDGEIATKGNLFGRKGIILKENKIFKFTKEEVDFGKIRLTSRRECRLDKDKNLITEETAEHWLSADALLGTIPELAKGIETHKKNLKICEIDDPDNMKETLERLLPLMDETLKSMMDLQEYAMEVSKEESIEREKLKNKTKGEN